MGEVHSQALCWLQLLYTLRFRDERQIGLGPSEESHASVVGVRI
jgi:hypothetical protein